MPNSGKPPFLSYGRQQISEEDIAAVVDCLRSDWLTQGPRVKAFEAALSERLDGAEVIVCNSGTAALHLAALAAGLGPETVAIVPSMTFVATANAVRMTGAEVAFCDVDPETGLMRAQDLTACIETLSHRFPGSRPVAVLPVHLNGQTVDLAALAPVARSAGITIIEDACHALGAEYRAAAPPSAKPSNWATVGACAETLAACFSFHPVKSIATGEGGAVALRDGALAEHIRRLRNHGLVREEGAPAADFLAGLGPDAGYAGAYQMPEIGFNYRLTDLQCALGLSQLARLDDFLAQRRALAASYDAQMGALSSYAQPIRWSDDCRPAYHLYPILLAPELAPLRGQIMAALRDAGIGTQVHYIPVHRQPYYVERYGLADLPGADSYFGRIMSLPIFVDMQTEDVERVIAALVQVLGEIAA